MSCFYTRVDSYIQIDLESGDRQFPVHHPTWKLCENNRYLMKCWQEKRVIVASGLIRSAPHSPGGPNKRAVIGSWFCGQKSFSLSPTFEGPSRNVWFHFSVSASSWWIWLFMISFKRFCLVNLAGKYGSSILVLSSVDMLNAKTGALQVCSEMPFSEIWFTRPRRDAWLVSSKYIQRFLQQKHPKVAWNWTTEVEVWLWAEK